MFRRKEESLFDTDLPEETESFTVVQPVAANAAVPAMQSPAQTVVAASTASVQPITRPSPIAATASGSSNTQNSTMPGSTMRTNAPVAPSAVTSPISRPTEGKSMISNPAQNNAKANSRILTVGNDILLKGEITTCDRLVIEGKVEATISEVNTIELAECGSFKGAANVIDAQISGLFEGDLVVTGRLVIYASGKVRGNITYGEIEIERGGELSGQIKAVGSAASAQSMPKSLHKQAA